MRSGCSANCEDPELLGPAARQLDFDLVARHVPIRARPIGELADTAVGV